jgi:hypothetical protein
MNLARLQCRTAAAYFEWSSTFTCSEPISDRVTNCPWRVNLFSADGAAVEGIKLGTVDV